MEFSRPEYRGGWPLPSPGDLPNPDCRLVTNPSANLSGSVEWKVYFSSHKIQRDVLGVSPRWHQPCSFRDISSPVWFVLPADCGWLCQVFCIWRTDGGKGELHMEGFNGPGREVEQSTSAHVPRARTQR